MSISSWVGLVAAGLVPLAVLAWLVGRFEARAQARVLGGVAAGGVLAAMTCFGLERGFETATGLGVVVRPGQAGSAPLVMFFFVAPLEEAAKWLVAAAAVRRRHLTGPREGVLIAGVAAAAFAAVESVLHVAQEPGWLPLVRVVAAVPAHLFCAGAWGYALGSKVRDGVRWFPAVLVLSIALHGLYDHIVFGRGAGVIALSVPLVVMMAVLGASVVRDVAPPRGPVSVLAASLPEPPSLRAMRRALRRSDQPLMVHWIAIGAFVNVGVVLSCLAGAVWLGHRWGVDFARADETDLASNGPIILLGTAVLLAFPIAGYLVARASGARSVLEPAMSTALALALVVALLSVTAPVALLFASAVAPVAFGLACGGAWFGVAR